MKIMRKKLKKTIVKCMRCEQTFSTWKALKVHSHGHLDTLREIKMLQHGHIPDETKMGAGFKGKNKIIIS
ncbi:MAG TPA: hypothetical protein VJH04_03130 [archaeon]|nr:hypothetical protein [archaeon]